jgi:hypothetical protein
VNALHERRVSVGAVGHLVVGFMEQESQFVEPIGSPNKHFAMRR